MRTAPVIQALWQAGGPFTGTAGKPQTRVTVQAPWTDLIGTSTALDFLRVTAADTGIGNWRPRGVPLRWYQRADNGQVEIEVPNVKSVQIDRSIDTDAGTCVILMYNQHMDASGVGLSGQTQLGQPGYFTSGRAVSLDSQARWGQTSNSWQNVFAPNALIRTYQGFGGATKTLAQCITDGNLIQSGVWLVDEVIVRSDGMLEMHCRDMAKLLIEQQLYPPLIPVIHYPLKYYRYVYTNVGLQGHARTSTTAATVAVGNKNTVYETSSVDAWYGYNFNLHGHVSTDSLDGNTDTFFLGEGNSRANAAFAVNYIQATCGESMNAVYVNPWAGNYTMYVSVMENGVWQGSSIVPYDPSELAATQSYVNTGANIPYVASFGVPWETAQEYALPRVYRADRVRITFRDLTYTDYGPWHYRAGVREWAIRASAGAVGTDSVTVTQLPWWLACDNHPVSGYLTADVFDDVDGFGLSRTTSPTGGSPPSSNSTVCIRHSKSGNGYYTLTTSGEITTFGDAPDYGDPKRMGWVPKITPDGLNHLMWDMAITYTGLGYWVMGVGGEIYAFGDATDYGNQGAAVGNVVASITSHPNAMGYWLVKTLGTVIVKGAASSYGNWGGVALIYGGVSTNRIRATSTGLGYWLMTGDGRIEAHGDAVNYGSTVSPTVDTDWRKSWLNFLPLQGDRGYILLRGDGYMVMYGGLAGDFYGFPSGAAASQRSDGNYLDWVDIIRDLALWSGFLLYDPTLAANATPSVYGNLETTGSFSPEPLPDDMFDKKPVIDAMHAIKEAVGYLLWVDDQGGLHFESPNWWSMGNWDEVGNRLTSLPEIDEKMTLTSYQLNTADDVLRSMIIISSENPDDSLASTVTTRVTPRSAQQLRGLIKPAMWVNGYFMVKAEQDLLAELIALHIHFQGRIGQVTCAANPAIQINDQVRIFERQTSETYIHYVRGITTTHDLDTGQYMMNLTTHWLGSDNSWAIQTTADPSTSAQIDPNYPYMFWPSDLLKKKLVADPRRFGLYVPGKGRTISAAGAQGGTGSAKG